MVDLGTHILIIEVDENKHSDYDCSCENKRIMELSQDVGHRCIVFIRFNPDGYTTQDGKRVTSPWRINKTSGIVQVSATRQKEWDSRMNNLLDRVKYWAENPTDKIVEVDALYY
jgi:hypothetical protein